MSKKYIGITIGPIFDTINLTSSPAALWAASYIFSTITRTVCEILTTSPYNLPKESIISPYYDPEEEYLNRNDGVGLFHDRIIFERGTFDIAKMEEIKTETLKRVTDIFFEKNDNALQYLTEYVMISYVAFEAKNPILESSQILDSMELNKPFVFNASFNPFLSLFDNIPTDSKTVDDEKATESIDTEEDLPQMGKNEAVKALTNHFERFQLQKRRFTDKNSKKQTILKSISDIANTHTNLKQDHYYAILRSDGDNIGKLIASLNSDEIREFSKTCLAYCANAAKAVGDYGGVTIYSGGDDLLAILPLSRQNKKEIGPDKPQNLFEFIRQVNGIFAESFKKYSGKNIPTSLSFGVTVAYNKFPLYEALADSASLLFGTAKSLKSCTAIRVQKHAGQSAGLIISHSKLDDWIGLTQTIQGTLVDESTEEKVKTVSDEILLSSMHKLELFKKAFCAATDLDTAKHLFVNIFDAEAHENSAFLHENLPAMLCFLQALVAQSKDNEGSKTITEFIYALGNSGLIKEKAVFTMQSILRIQKLWIEKGGE